MGGRYLAPIHRQLRQFILALFTNGDFEIGSLRCFLREFGPDGAACGVVERGVVVAEVDAACFATSATRSPEG